MGFERSHIFGKVEVDIRSTVAGTIVFQTETPGQTLVSRFSMPIPITSGRTVLRSRLPGTMQGHFVRSTGTPASATNGYWELYGVRVWSRELPDGQWAWTPLPVMDSPVEFVRFNILEDPTQGGGASVGFSEFKIPVEPTPEMYQELKLPAEPTPVEFTQVKLPAEETAVEFSAFKLPVEPTGESFSPIPVPVEPTPVEFTQFKILVEATADSYSPFPIPMDSTPAEFSPLKLPVPVTPEDYTGAPMPVPPTPDDYAAYSVPVKPTPPVPLWVPVSVDE